MRKRAAFAAATEVRLLAEQLPNQASLNTCLLGETDTGKRRIMYDFMRPFLKFPNPEFPSELMLNSRIIRP